MKKVIFSIIVGLGMFCETVPVAYAAAGAAKTSVQYRQCVSKAQRLKGTKNQKAALALCRKLLITPAKSSDFEITKVTVPPLISNGPRVDVTVYWTGNPTYPVTINYFPKLCPTSPTGCVDSNGYSFVPLIAKFGGQSEPFVIKDGAVCINGSGLLFDYGMTITDAKGRVTPVFDAPVTCQ